MFVVIVQPRPVEALLSCFSTVADVVYSRSWHPSPSPHGENGTQGSCSR